MRKIHLLSAAAVLAMPVAGYAQQITTQIVGQVAGPDGAPLAGATVVVTDTRTNVSSTYATNAEGVFQARNLQPGGPYTVTATAPGFQGQTVENLQTTLQGATELTFTLDSAVAADEAPIIVTAQRAEVQLRAIGPGVAYGEEVLESFPSFTNDIRDIIRIDPRVSLDRDLEVDRISCLGGNDRANTFTVDGIVQADVFGLNGTPFAARNSLPLPYGVIRQTSVEFAPFDVQYGRFTGCAVNVVTKSGQNTFHGSAFFNFTSDDLTGSEVDGQDFTPAPFKEYRWGATLNGPIIPDHLFFSFGYEETDTGDSQDLGPTGAGFANELEFVTIEQFNEVAEILRSTYGVDPGEIARSLPEKNRRFFGRLDWIINDAHRLELTYQRLEETNLEPDGLNNETLTGINTFEDEGTLSNYYSGRFYSQWTDTISTELRISHADVKDVQGPFGGGEAQSENPLPRIVVGVERMVDGELEQGSILAGPGFSRSANELQTKITQAKFKVDAVAGDHLLTFGAEVNHADVFNLFVQNATGTLTFASIDDLRAGLLTGGGNTFPDPEDILDGSAAGAYGNFTPSGDVNDAAAEWVRTIYTVYAQDEWTATDNLTLLGGLRIDWYDGDAPPANPNFFARYGFTNANPFSKIDPVLLPRFAFTYDLEPFSVFSNTQVRGGVGIFSGGDPAVWFSNAFSNPGIGAGQGVSTNPLCNAAEGPDGRIDVVQNGQFTGIPQCIVQAGGQQAARALADTQSTDPNLKIATVTRANIGIVTRLDFTGGGGFFDDWRLNLDYIYSRFNDPYNFVDLAQTPDIRKGLGGFTIDGRPIYQAIDPTRTGCTAVLQGTGGTPPVYTNVNSACFGTSRDDEIQLTNADGYDSHVASIVLNKRFGGGIFVPGGSTFVSMGYAFTDSNDRRNLGSSTSTSNYDVTAAFDRQAPGVSTSFFETRHNVTFAATFANEFFGEYETRFGWVFVARSGRPYSITFDGGGVLNDSASGSDNALAYIPTGVGDPNVVYLGRTGQTGAQAELLYNAYIDQFDCIAKYRGQTIPRNTCNNDWFFDLDLQFSQELPGPARLFGVEDEIELFVNFDNFLNLLNSEWNVFRRQRDFAGLVDVIDLASIDSQGRYVLRDFNPDDTEVIQVSSSVWRIQFGVRYKF